MKQPNKSEIKLRITLTSETLTSEEMAAAAGLRPSGGWRQGERVHPRAKNVHAEHGCFLQIVDASLSRAATRLKRTLEAQGASLNALPESVCREVSCVVNVYDMVPELYLEPEFVKFAGSIGAALDFDVYVLG